jgi:hypothetical protein
MGPYDTRELAEAALSRAKQRTEAWDAEDVAWRERPSRPPTPPAPPG